MAEPEPISEPIAEPMESWSPNWAYTGEAELEFLLAEAKEALQGTVDLGISSDQRSAALAGVFGAGAFGLFTVAATIFAGQAQSGVFLAGAMVVGFLLLVASVLCTLAAFPGDFFVSGYEPRLLFPAASDQTWMKRYTIEDMQVRIENNRREINREAGMVKAAIISATIALAASFLFVSVGIVQIQRSQDVSRPSSTAGSAPAGAVEITLWNPVSGPETEYFVPSTFLIDGQNTMPPPDKQHLLNP